MPRGVTNAKRDELALRFTTFNAPLLVNPKQNTSNYLKHESQTLWARNAARSSKNDVVPQEGRRGSKVVVIHPGTRNLRIGRASDVVPVSVPHVIARRVHTPPATPPKPLLFIKHPKKNTNTEGQVEVENEEDISDETTADEHVRLQEETSATSSLMSNAKIENSIVPLVSALRDRMRFYKLRVVPNASKVASSFNEQMVGEGSPGSDTPSRIEGTEDVLVGEDVFDLPDEGHALGYAVRWPIYAGRFNTRDYNSHQNVLDDIEEIWRTTLRDKLGIDPTTFKEYSVVLVVPDVWDRFYVHELVNMLLSTMGFKQIVCQQESLAATYGAGISNACVIDIGSAKTSVSCVDDGLVLAETRMILSIAGDDITEFLSVLLDRISFPYKELDLAQMHDWAIMEDLKCRICTLNEADVALNLYDFWVRRPGKKHIKYGLRAYDEVILAPMLFFDQRIVDIELKRNLLRRAGNPDITDEMIEYSQDQITGAMLISTQHLMPAPPAPTLSGPSKPASGAVTPQPEVGIIKFDDVKNSAPSATETKVKVEGKQEVIDVDAEMADVDANEKQEAASAATRTSKSPSAEREEPSKATTPSQQDVPQGDKRQTSTPAGNGTSTSATPVGGDNPTTGVTAGSTSQPLVQQQVFPGGYPVDVPFEASKLPLDVAIYNSARAAGGDDRIRKYLQAVLVVGGGALTPGIVHALESRLQAIATPLVPHMEKVQIIPPPKDIDPRMLSWKGAAVLGKMDGVADLWVTTADWDLFGMRALKERCYYL